MTQKTIKLNGRSYKFPKHPLVVICVDGCQQEYIHAAISAGVAPFLQGLMQGKGSFLLGDCVVPSFTNPNNMSIITGVPPKKHGICGNFFFDKESQSEVMMNDPKYLLAPTIMAKASAMGLKCAVVTAKDKLRTMLGHEMKGICFSSEKADKATKEANGIDNLLEFVGLPLPSVYSADLSQFVFAAGVKILQKHRPDLMYLSTTDYIQHKEAPGTKIANEFYAMMDKYVSQLHELGARIVITADHGMQAKHDTKTHQPNVLYAQDYLDTKFGAGKFRVILPITDPYVVHHGALGSYASIYINEGGNKRAAMDYLGQNNYITHCYTKAQAADKFELHKDRIGDIIVVSRTDCVIGTKQTNHDLSKLDAPLRSHGGISEQQIPIITNWPLKHPEKERRWRNFDAFHIGLNMV